MSRCKACDEIMTNRDMKRKSVTTGEYIDLCGHCFDTIKDQVHTNDNDPLIDIEELEAFENEQGE